MVMKLGITGDYQKFERSQVQGLDEPPLNLENVDLGKRDLSRCKFDCVILRGANLSDCELDECDFSASDLSEVSLAESHLEFDVKFVETTLVGAKFSGSLVTDAVFSDADLRRASFHKAQVEMSLFAGSDLRFVDFSNARLSGVRFDGSDLSDADFSGVTMDSCVFLNTDLRNTKGLSTVVHAGPSSIALETLFQSKGKVPKRFLIGSGIPAHFVQQIPGLVRDNSKPFNSCFISHSTKDKTFSERLYKTLRRLGLRVWYFPEQAKWGRDVWEEIDSAIRVYDKVIVVCSKFSLESQPVLREIERTLEHEDRKNKEILFPIRIDDYIFNSWKHPRRSDVIKRVVGDFRSWRKAANYELSIRSLIKNLESVNRKCT